MDLKSQSQHFHTDQAPSLLWDSLILQAVGRQRSLILQSHNICGWKLTVHKRDKFSSIRTRHIRAWTKASENFYGDDDDTLFEPTRENQLSFTETVGLTSASALPRRETSHIRSLRWPLWILGPCVLLTAGVLPTLWLPCVPLFEGSATAGLLALAGLDGIFNLGASMFLLMTDSCARTWSEFMKTAAQQLPLSYKVWTLVVNTIGFLAPFLAFIASKRGLLGPEPALLPVSAMIAPYSALLLVHTFTELLVWQWESPVWAILPLVYDAYGVLQLSRGLQLGKALGAPEWSLEAVKGLISWWVFALAVQLMWIAWFLGHSRK